MAIQDLLNMILQLDALDIQQQNANLEAQKAQQGYLNSFIKNLENVENPEQLGALQRTYSKQFGLPADVLAEVSANYVPGLEAQRAQATQAHRKRIRGTTAETDLNQTAAYSNLAGTGEGVAAVERNISAASQDPTINTQVAKRGGYFSRIGYNPGQFAVSEAIGALPPSTLQAAAQYETRTAIDPATQAGLGLQASGQVLQRDIAQAQQQLGRQGLNLQNLISSRQYSLGLLPYMAAKMGVGGDSKQSSEAFEQFLKSATTFKDLERAQAAGVSPTARAVYDKFLRDIAEAMAGVKLPQGTEFNPSLMEKWNIR